MITASQDSAGNLRLDSWALQPTGMRLLRAEWPLPQPTELVSPTVSQELAKFLGKKKAARARLLAYGEKFADVAPPRVEEGASNG